jgi:hypothetical protein
LKDRDFLVGAQVNFVDFILFELLEKAQDAHIFDGKFFDIFPKFAAYHQRIAELTRMSAEERKNQGLFNGWRAKLGGAGEDMYRKYKKLD